MNTTNVLLIILIITIVACTSVVGFVLTSQNTNQNMPSENVTNLSSSDTVEQICEETSTDSSQENSNSHKSTADLALEWSGTDDGKVNDVISDGDQKKADYLNSQIDHYEGHRVYYKDGSSAEFVDKS